MAVDVGNGFCLFFFWAASSVYKSFFMGRFLLFRFMLVLYLQIHGGFIALFVGSVRFVFKLTCRCYWIGRLDYTRLPLRICGGTASSKLEGDSSPSCFGASSAFAVPRFGSPVFCFASHRFSIVNPRHATTLGSSLRLDSSLPRILSRIAKFLRIFTRKFILVTSRFVSVSNLSRVAISL